MRGGRAEGRTPCIQHSVTARFSSDVFSMAHASTLHSSLRPSFGEVLTQLHAIRGGAEGPIARRLRSLDPAWHSKVSEGRV